MLYCPGPPTDKASSGMTRELLPRERASSGATSISIPLGEVTVRVRASVEGRSSVEVVGCGLWVVELSGSKSETALSVSMFDVTGLSFSSPASGELFPDPTSEELFPDPTSGELFPDPTSGELFPAPTSEESLRDTSEVMPASFEVTPACSEVMPDSFEVIST